jgi:hypothetical protein
VAAAVGTHATLLAEAFPQCCPDRWGHMTVE